MNASEYLNRIENKRLNSTPLYSREEMISFAEKYAELKSSEAYRQGQKDAILNRPI